MQATMAPSAGVKAAAMAGDPRAGKYLIYQLGSE
jgi:hypothetical protein